MPQDITIADKKKFPYWQGRKPRTPLEGNIVKIERKDETIYNAAQAYLADLINEHLHQHGDKQAAIAKKTGLSQGQISRLISGKRGEGIKLKTYFRAIIGLGGNMQELYRKLGFDNAAELLALLAENEGLADSLLVVMRKGGTLAAKLEQDIKFLAATAKKPE